MKINTKHKFSGKKINKIDKTLKRLIKGEEKERMQIINVANELGNVTAGARLIKGYESL